MNRSRLTLTGLTLAGLLFSWSAAQALDYEVYPSQLSPAAKLAFANQAPPDVAYVLTDPDKDSTITALQPGERTEILPGERVYLPAGIYNLSVIGDMAEVYYGPGVEIHNAPGILLRVGGPLGRTQLLGPGPEHRTTGLVISGDVEIANTIIAGHFYGMNHVYRGQSIHTTAYLLYIANSEVGIAGPNLVRTPNPDIIRIDIQEAILWRNKSLDLSFFNLTYSHIIFRAVNSSFISEGKEFGGYTTDIGHDNDADDKLKYTAEFVNCVFNLSFWLWAPGDEMTHTRLYESDGSIRVFETRPGRNGLVQVWPLTAPIDPADFNVDGVVSLADFTYLVADFGKGLGQSRFARYYDLDESGVAADEGDLLAFARAFAGLPGDAPDSDLLASPELAVLAEVLYWEYRPVADALMAHPVFGPAITAYLERTAVAEVSGETPSEFSLGQNYPNPFNAETTIRFNLPADSHVLVAIYNSAGQEVVRIVDEMLPTGSYLVRWDGRDREGQLLASGVYLYRIAADGYAEMRKMSLLR